MAGKRVSRLANGSVEIPRHVFEEVPDRLSLTSLGILVFMASMPARFTALDMKKRLKMTDAEYRDFKEGFEVDDFSVIDVAGLQR